MYFSVFSWSQYGIKQGFEAAYCAKDCTTQGMVCYKVLTVNKFEMNSE